MESILIYAGLSVGFFLLLALASLVYLIFRR